MGYNKYVNSTVQPIYGDESGMGWGSASGGSGTVALSGGGIPVVRRYADNGYTDIPLNVPVFTRPSSSDASYIEIGLAVPDGGVLGLRDAWVIYWEED